MKIELLSQRILAYLIDSFVVQFICVLITDTFELNKKIGSFTFLDRSFLISFSCYFIVLFVYLILMDLLADGKTLGKRVLRLETIGQNGQSLSISVKVFRSFLKTIALSFLLPLFYSFFAAQTLHDRVAISKTVRTS